jgi:hypothetical protein
MSSKTPAGGVLLSLTHRFACASWPTFSADRYTGPWNATTPNPILVIGTRFDPSTCVMQATSRYLVNLTTAPSGTVCPSDRLPFDPDFGQPVP